MISGIEFKNLCKWNLCSRYDQKFDIKNIKENDFIFINLDNIYQFTNLLKNNKFPIINIITHNSDKSFDKDMLLCIYPFINNVCCINCVVNDDKIRKIPLGFSDRLVPTIKNIDKKYDKKNILYMNFCLHSGRIKERVECNNYFKNFDWIKNEDNIPEIDFYNSLKNSKYSLCPVGAGLDTHRFYESIYFDTIPIIKRNELSDLHSKFPCVIVDDWKEITYDKLNNDYKMLYNILIDWKNKNQNWINAEYWM
jgi:hypothetical protein